MINRRLLLKSTVATLLAGSMQKLTFAASSTSFGPWQIDVISDGFMELPMSRALPGASEAELKKYMGDESVARGSYRIDCNLVVLRRDDQVILVDAGAGPSFLDNTGVGVEALSALGIEPDQVTHVVFTHAHPDHLWGVKDDFDEVLFTEATHWIAEREWNYWTDPATVSQIDADRQFFAVGAKDRLGIIAEQSERFNPEQEILPGIIPFATHGHTPGHVSIQVTAENESLVIVGDALTNALYSFAEPSRLTGSDQNAQQAAETRVKLLDRLQQQNSMVIGFHFPYPGIGRVESAGSAYRFVAS